MTKTSIQRPSLLDSPPEPVWPNAELLIMMMKIIISINKLNSISYLTILIFIFEVCVKYFNDKGIETFDKAQLE